MNSKLHKRLIRLDQTYSLAKLLLSSHSRKYPKKMRYLELLRDYCFERGNELFRQTDLYAVMKFNEGMMGRYKKNE